ncbi:FK506-binding protein 15-like isoform X5 [Pomacea canaliculata]|uniref:FK506-binding protein 15-like isoform X5 n=1 Tax=Pomacea canaliculata TaxID=400727 RepID=UPI000D736F57|nr:FK506-binding protein 15-like isoform X5 [Pomacea canaliculata]
MSAWSPQWEYVQAGAAGWNMFGDGTKLASVFGMDKANNQGGNESLTYTAPKQPKKKEGGADGSPAATAVKFATVVQAYKFVDNQYASQGKVGAAILANHQGSDYHILLYINKQQQLTNVKILPTFTFNIQQNNYANFYDEARTNWSVMFNNSQDAEKFAKEVGLAKALASGGRLESVVQQELQLGEGGGLEAGDSVEVKYTGWLMTNNTFGQVFDSNANSDKLFRFKLGKGKVIKGWDTGMLGMRKGSKRLLVIPPNVGYGSQGLGDRIPPNSTLIFEVEVLRVKLQKGESTPEQVVHPTVPSPGPAVILADVPFVDHDESVKDRSRSITEQLTNAPASDKAKLISRMAKMGQPMLPTMLGGIPTQQDSEDEMTPTQPAISKPPLAAKPQAFPHPHQTQPHLMQPTFQQHIPMAEQPMAQTPPYMQQMVQPPVMGGMPVFTPPVSQPAFLQNLPGSQQLSVYQPPPSLLQQQQQALLAMQQQQQQQQQQMQGFQLSSQTAGLLGQPAHMADPMTPILLTETRQQNTEVRLTVNKMSDKVDKILEKVESLNNGVMQLQPLPAPTMETSILLHNISRIIQENERLKKDVFERGEKIETQNEKIAELLQKNQRFVEKSNFMLEERNEGYKMTANQAQVRILALEQEKVQMATELSSASSRLASLQLELGELRKTEGELRQRLQSNTSSSTEQKEELERLRLQRAEDEKKLVDLNNLLREEKTARKQTEGQLTAMQEEMADLRTTSSNQERALNERKRKAVEEKKKLEEEIEEIKAGYEQDLQILRAKLKKQRATTDVETADRVNKLEEELASEWQSKCDKLLAAANDKHERQLAMVREDLKEAQDKASTLEAKVQELRALGSSTDIKMAHLHQQLEENLTFKEKYENLRIQASTMKQKYEDRISDLEDEAETLTTRIKDLEQQLLQTRQQVQLQQEQFQQQQEQLQQQQQRLQQAASAAGSGGGGDVTAEVKRIMNSVFQSLRKEFEADETYLGTEIMATVLNVIKETTLKLVQQQSPASAQNDPDEEEESEDEEDEEDEEEEEEEEESEPVAVEETFVESTVSAAATLAASPPLIQQKSETSEDVEKSVSPTTYPVTGDKGNPYYSQELDAVEKPLTSVTDHVTGDRGNPYHSQKLDSSLEVEESVTSTAFHVTGDKGNPYFSKELDVGSAEVTKLATYHVTGDKGNPYYSQELDVHSAVEELMTSVTDCVAGDRGNPYYSQKLDKQSSDVEESLTATTCLVTGDKGNPYYSKELDADIVVEKLLTSVTDHVTGDRGNPYHSQKLDGSSGVEELMKAASADFTGEKGNPYHSCFLDAISDDADNSPESPEGSFQSVNSNLDILGDSGEANIAKTEGQDAQKQTLPGDSEEETKEEKNKEEENPHLQTLTQKKPEENQTFQAEPDAPAEQEPTTMTDDDDDDILKEVLEPSSAKDPTPVTPQSKEVEKDPLSADIETLESAMETVHQQPKETTVKPRASSSASSEDNRERTGSASVLPALVSREPPPLFDDDDDDSPLFGADSTVADTFGSPFQPTNNGDASKKAPEKKPITTSKLPSKADLSMDDDTKPKPPPPLFGDDDDDDLDWLS